MSRSRRVVAAVLTLVAGLGLALAPPAGAKAPNLLPNPGFEESAIEPGPAAGQSPQPLLPTGWAFEGLAGLFDHSPHGGSNGSPRSAAISIPAGGKRAICGPEIKCNDNPLQGLKDDAVLYLTVNPAWRNLQAVPVTAGKSYELSVDLKWELATEGEGAFGMVRWYDGTTPVEVTSAFDVRSTAATSPYRDWKRAVGVVKAPAGATSAVVLLGATDDVFIGKFLFDQVYFGLR